METYLARTCLSGASTGGKNLKVESGQVLWAAQFTSLILFFFFGWLCLLGSKFCFYFGITDFLGILR